MMNQKRSVLVICETIR